jgi:hypothetical protein
MSTKTESSANSEIPESSTIFLPSSPGTVNDLMTQTMAGFQSAKPQS